VPKEESPMQAYLTLLKGTRPDLTFSLAETGTHVGRSSGCLVQLPSSMVSKRHACVRKQGERWVVEDLGSKNGTRVNGRRVETADLRHGDRIAFGDEELVFTCGEVADSHFAPGHVIDLSSGTSHETMGGSRVLQSEDPGDDETEA
jgi:pSer/pThr/pTyr-binding forkhead associated (FHA) protein